MFVCTADEMTSLGKQKLYCYFISGWRYDCVSAQLQPLKCPLSVPRMISVINYTAHWWKYW